MSKISYKRSDRMDAFLLLRSVIFMAVLVTFPGCQTLPDHSEDADSEDRVGDLRYELLTRWKECNLVTPDERFRRTPDWKMRGRENPPLLPGRAVALARRKLSETFTDADKWSVERVELTRWPKLVPQSYAIRDKWWYRIWFTPPSTEEIVFNTGVVPHFIICVLMDGSVIPPSRTAE